MNSSIRRLSCFFALLSLLVSCYPPVSPEKQLETREGLDTALAELPTLASFITIKVLVYESYDNEHSNERVCYYAKGYVVAGSSLPEADALDAYTQKVQALGWTRDMTQYGFERLLNRGANESMVIFSYEPGIEIRDAVGYTQLKKEYKSVIVIRVDYTVPARDGC